jgi:hypothetical protein
MLENKLLPALIFSIGIGFLGNNYEYNSQQKFNYEKDATIPISIVEILDSKYNLIKLQESK